ncbi:MAG: response regulator [Longimicrobiales bacterium]
MRILYVEDDPVDGDLARLWLQRHTPHHRLDLVNTVADAMERLTNNANATYDVLLTDLRLPDGDGLTLLREVRQRSLPLAVVVVTSAGSEETALAALKAGADDYVIKAGVYLEQLPLTLENAFHRHQAEAARRARPLVTLYAEHNATDIKLALNHFALHARHIRLDVATTGTEALARLANGSVQRYDVCLLDYRMPGLDGLELLKQLRYQRQLDVPVVLITGQGDDDVMLQALRLGASGYVIKNPGYLYRLPAELESAHYRVQLEKDQAALRESQERLDRTESFALVMPVHAGLDGRLLKVPPTLSELLGYTENELLSRSFQDLALDEDREATWNACLGLLGAETRSCSMETRLVRGDGQAVWCFVNASVVTDALEQPVHFRVYLMDIRQRKGAEIALRDSEERKRAMLSALPDLMFTLTEEGVYLDYHAKNVDDLMVPPEAFLGKNVRDVLPADIADGFFACLRKARDTSDAQILEYSLNLRGEERFFEARIVHAEAGRILSIVREITDRKRADQALSQSRDRIRLLAGHLIAAQEEERVRIANELHDDLSQGMAALTISLSRLRQQMSGSPGPYYDAVSALERQAATLVDRTRALSHQLHSAVLEHIGLPAALKALCSDFAAIEAHLEVGALPAPLAPPVQLCIYRVVQETLRNAARHSGADRAFVRLNQVDGLTELTVSDAGTGFDPEHARDKGGLGLISLEERVRLIGGTLQILTAPGCGTEFRVCIPTWTT